ncbi:MULTISPECIES: magnesium transporter [Marinobacter]|jgi:magnesium transporter|uniref:Magnesium transporter MgtE n=2 Tax=Marinobacter TaxID=2742 RepID=A0A455W5P1_MARNT|nr:MULTISPECIES: magnesium transporter [Marinobacter]MDX5439693.1 magnesium transporter [Alteromonadaceae bacterium]BBJ04696.1 magnesium transporter MgtE [Marinobacter nauticus]MAO14585.1 magnesium transporter [Marinobacter sp.]MDX5335061.1 magnesium transporter [Marinobacter sp.]MDX5385768.1 magnesium transporter [Marinobacter sp.]
MTDILEKSQARQRLRSLSEALDSGALKQVARILNGGLSPSDIAHLLESSPPRQRALLWNLVDKQLEGEVLQYLGDDIRAYFLSQLNAQELADIIEDFESDDLADLLQQLPDTVIQEVLDTMDEQDRQRVEEVLSYPEDTAGGLMNTDTITVRPDISIDVVLRYLRRHRNLPPMTDSLIVVSRRDEFIGMLPITRMLVSNPASTVREVMDTDIEPIPVTLSDTKVATLFERYDLISAPVVGDDNKLLGRITIDDVVDVIREDADHSLMSMAGLDEDEDTFAPVIKTTRRRAVWLGINVVTAFTSASVIGMFEETIQQVVALAVLMPIVASMGGIAGSQTLTLMIRGMAVGQVSNDNVKWLLNREFLATTLNGFLFALVVSAAAMVWFRDPTIGLVIAMALVINLTIASIVGTLLPLTLKRLNIDPALAGGVILLTTTDVVGFLSFLGLATYFYA